MNALRPMALTRTEQISRIRGRDTEPELLLRSLLWRAGFRYRVSMMLPVGGRPDLVFLRRQVAVFVDGCFWHGCPEHYVRPRSRESFWAGKLLGNVERDRLNTRLLEGARWRVCRLWEHQVFEAPEDAAGRVTSALTQLDWRPPRSPRVIRVEHLEEADGSERRTLIDLRGSADGIWTDLRVRTTTKWKRVSA